MVACLWKAAAFQKPLKIIPCRMLHYAECTKRNFMGIVLDHDFFVLEVYIDRCAKLVAVQKAHPGFHIRVIAEAVSAVDLIVHGLPTDLKSSCDLRNAFSLLLASQPSG